ncbi:MAG: baseplate J/gp47 family protein [Pigmentiphaga sp.]|nr:baseplate J/gp47 family protein [Pigmentiphaga sp.]
MTLPEPHFIDRDGAAITAQMIAAYEEATGRPLQPAQVERLIVNLIAYRENLVRIGIQEAAKQNLLAFARFPMIDYLGELLGVVRLPQSPAVTTLRFSLAAAQELPAIVPAGTRARTGDGRFTFASDRLAQVPAGSLFVDVPATASEVGAAGNGYAPGQAAQLLDPVAPVVAVTNVSETHGGRDTEDDERLRERIREAPEKFSVAGPYGAYRWHAMTAHQSIVDAAVISPEPGIVQVYILTDEGLPSSEILDIADDVLNHEKVRPLSDTVEVLAPARIAYSIEAQITLFRSADATVTLAAANAAAAAYVAARRDSLGRDLVPSQIIAALSVPGAYRVDLVSPGFRQLGQSEWADCEAVDIVIAGVGDD